MDRRTFLTSVLGLTASQVLKIETKTLLSFPEDEFEACFRNVLAENISRSIERMIIFGDVMATQEQLNKEALESWDRHLPKFPKLMEWARQEKLRNNV